MVRKDRISCTYRMGEFELKECTDVMIPFRCPKTSILAHFHSSLQVSYTAASQAPTVSVTGFQALTVSHSIVITGLPDSDEVTYSVELRNSQGSVMMSSLSIDLRDSTPGAVQSLMVTDITADSVTLDWDEPTQTNGDIDGYSISWNGGRVHVCCVLCLNSVLFPCMYSSPGNEAITIHFL